jgi:DNA-binding transcriptional MerR regulator
MHGVYDDSARGLTIGQLAQYAGVTIKAVRHYHRRGLLPEPPRDASGYRRYTAEDAIALVKIRTLAEAGVPLARVKSLLAAEPGEFVARIAEIDRKLQERAEELLRTRERIARLSAGDRLFVSEEVADLLDRLRQFGVSQRTVQMERDLWILMQSVAPAEAAVWLADKREALADPEFRAIYLEYDAAFDWHPDDSRLESLAERGRLWLTHRLAQAEVGERRPARSTNQSVARLFATSSGASSPAWDHLAELAMQTRGCAERGDRHVRVEAQSASQTMDSGN